MSRWTAAPTSSGGASAQSSLPGYWVGAYGGLVVDVAALGASFTSASTVVQNHQIAADCVDLRLVLPHGWRVSTSTPTATADTAAPNGNATRVSVQIGTATYPVTFRSGARSVTCDPGGRLVSDPIGGYWAKGTQVKVRILGSYISGQSYPITIPATGPGVAPAFTDNHFAVNSDIVDSTTSGTGNPNDDIWGGALLGRPIAAKPFSLGFIGDSVTFGAGDTGVGYAWATRATNATVPCFRFCRSGLTAQGVAAFAPYSMPMMSASTHVVVALGVNDMQNNRTLVQAKADLTKIFRAVAGGGSKVIGMTVPPVTTSTDAWATTANQTASGAAYTGGASSRRAQLNTWIRAGADGLLAGYVEFADAVETARDSGIWKAAHTADGVHPNATGHAAAATSVNLTAIAAL